MSFSLSLMADRPRSPSADFFSILGNPKNMCKAYKLIAMKRHPHRNKSEADFKFQDIHEPYRALDDERIKASLNNSGELTRPTTVLADFIVEIFDSNDNDYKSMGEEEESLSSSKPSVLKRLLSRRSAPTTPGRSAPTTPGGGRSPTYFPSWRSPPPSPTYFCNSGTASQSTSPTATPEDGSHRRSKSTTRRCCSETEIPSLSRNTSRGYTTTGTPIVYSQSTARRKPPPTDMKLVCTLEDLFYGCIKQIKISKDVIRNGIIEREEETIKINVKPGWKKGTKITFEGKGEERPGYYPADIVFTIDEEEHPFFKRVGDDLEYEAKVPLVKALTGCTVSVPLLGGGKMSLSLDEIIYPGYEKVVCGQGMPITAGEEGKRGDLRVKFVVHFPAHLNSQQRSLAYSILQQCS